MSRDNPDPTEDEIGSSTCSEEDKREKGMERLSLSADPWSPPFIYIII